MSDPFPKATVDIYQSEIPAIIKSFSLFLGRENLDRRIATANKMLAGAAPLYRAYFVTPKQFLWIGTREIVDRLRENSFNQERLTPYALASLHHIASIRNVLPTMPSWKKKEFRARLTDKKGGDIPALIEIATASRIVTLGGTVKWMAERGTGERVFEMLVSYKGHKLEVECKAKTVDAGRQFARGALYQFADTVLLSEIMWGGPRFVTITMDARFPTDRNRQLALVATIEELVQSGGTKDLDDGSVLVENLTVDELNSRGMGELKEFEHRLVVPRELVISFQSRKPDRMITKLEGELRDALNQFTGERPAALICYVPEIDSFQNAENPGTATYELVHRILARPDAQNLVSLTFFSDPIFDRRSGEIDTGLPSLRFVSTKFRGSPLEIF